jgi:hypothetical protein
VVPVVISAGALALAEPRVAMVVARVVVMLVAVSLTWATTPMVADCFVAPVTAYLTLSLR